MEEGGEVEGGREERWKVEGGRGEGEGGDEVEGGGGRKKAYT